MDLSLTMCWAQSAHKTSGLQGEFFSVCDPQVAHRGGQARGGERKPSHPREASQCPGLWGAVEAVGSAQGKPWTEQLSWDTKENFTV